MAVGGVDDDEVDPGLDQALGALVAGLADRRRRGDPQAALVVLAGIGIGHRLLHVLHRDQADAAVLVVHHQQLFDAVLVQQALGLVLADALAHRHQPVLGHQLGHRLPRVGGKAHVAVGEDAHQAARRAGALDHRDPGDPVLLHQRQRIGQRRLRMDGQGIHDHPGFELLDPAHQPGLQLRVEIAVDDPDAAGLGHGDRHGGLGHGVHRRGDDGDVQEDVAGDSGADVDFGGQDVGKAGLQ